MKDKYEQTPEEAEAQAMLDFFRESFLKKIDDNLTYNDGWKVGMLVGETLGEKEGARVGYISGVNNEPFMPSPAVSFWFSEKEKGYLAGYYCGLEQVYKTSYERAYTQSYEDGKAEKARVDAVLKGTSGIIQGKIETLQLTKCGPVFLDLGYQVEKESLEEIDGIRVRKIHKVNPQEVSVVTGFLGCKEAKDAPESPEVDFVVQGTSSAYDNLLNESVAPIEAISRIEADELKDRLCRDLTALVAMAFYEGMKDSNAPRQELKSFDYKIAVRKLVCSGCLIPSDDFVNYGTALMVKYYKTGVTYANEKVQED